MILTREQFDEWAAKAPGNRAGPRRTADRLWSLIEPALTHDECSRVFSGLGHAIIESNSDRAEFDRVVSEIRRRLFPE